LKQSPRNHVFRGKKYKIFFRPPKNRKHLGTCDFDVREIEIRPNLEGKERLDCIIHEALHACFPDIDDDAIDETGTSISDLLIKFGYKETKERNK